MALIKKKRCCHCKIIKPLDCFSKNKSKKDGKQSRCKECRKKYYEKNKDKIAAYQKKNKDKIAAYQKEYQKEYRKKNKDKRAASQKKRRKNDPKYRLSQNMSNAIYKSLKGNKNGRHWEDMVGYSLDDLKTYLEKRFTDGMSWENYGTRWHKDHSTPISAFNYSSPDDIDFKLCWALKNLQPMLAEENRRKSNKLDKPFQPSFSFERA